jgi:hypothetical protein
VSPRSARLKLVRHSQTGSQKRTLAPNSSSAALPPPGLTRHRAGKRARVFCEDKPIPGTNMRQTGGYILLNPSRILNTAFMKWEEGVQQLPTCQGTLVHNRSERPKHPSREPAQPASTLQP